MIKRKDNVMKMMSNKGLAIMIAVIILVVTGSIFIAIFVLHDNGNSDQAISRGEFCVLLAKHLELDTSDAKKEPPTFPDIRKHSAEKYIEALTDAGIIDPADYPNGFRPDEAITRAEIVKMLVRAKGKDEEAKNTQGHTGYADQDEIKDPDKGYIIVGLEEDIINNTPDKKIHPNESVPKKEAKDLVEKIAPNTPQPIPDIPQPMPNPTSPLPIPDQPTPTPVSEDPEQNKPTPTPTPVNPGNDSGGSSGGSSGSTPKAQIRFELLAVAHTDTEIQVMPVWKYMRSFTWTLTRTDVDGSQENVEMEDVINGALGLEGGIINFKEDGQYTLIATAVNSRGKETVLSKQITVYPVIDLSFELPETIHTDKFVPLTFSLEKLFGHDIVWTAEKGGVTASPADILNGELDNEGGIFAFTAKGSYSLTAIIVDETGRIFTHTESTEVYPVVEISFELPATCHIDTVLDVSTTLTEATGLPVVWSLVKNGEAAELGDELEGNLTDERGQIRFKNKGVYVLTGTLIDETGRIFEASKATTVYPVGSIGFYLPEITHTDTTVLIEATFQHVGNAEIRWSLTKDGDPVSLADYIEGDLTETNSNIRFREKGEYVLKAAFSDPAGRTYSYTAPVKVYPVPIISYVLPETAHSDTIVPIYTVTSEMEGLTVEWMLENGFGFQDWPTYIDGTLANDGGSVHFKHAGIYEVIARITDETGRVFLFEGGGKIEVLPVLNISFQLPEATHTDRTIDLRTRGNNVLPVEWTLTKGERLIELSDVLDGTLNAYGGKIRFVETGEYTLTASMTDALGRTFTHSETVAVHPVPRITLTLLQTGYASENTEISVSGTDVDGLVAEWTFSKDGNEAEPYSNYAEGELSESGGTLKFKEKGRYTVILTMTDSLGRNYEQSKSVTIYPIPKIQFVLPQVPYVGENTLITVAGSDLDNLLPTWTITKDGNTPKPYADYADGELASAGGTISFKSKGNYALILTMTDVLGRAFTKSVPVTVYPIPFMQISLPSVNYNNEPISVVVSGSELDGLTFVWNLSIDGAGAPYTGTLGKNGGEIHLSTDITKTIKLTAVGTDQNGRSFTFQSPAVKLMPIVQCSFNAPTAVHVSSNINITMQTVSGLEGKSIVWSLTKDGNAAVYNGSLSNNGGNINIGTTGAYVLTAKVTNDAGRTFSYAKNINITNTAPNKPTGGATVIRSNSKEGKLYVNITFTSTDPDGDTITYEYSGKSADGYYAAGAHTVRVRARDAYGLYSDWTDINFTVVNSAPATPVITRTPSGNSVAPGTAVTITATASDSDGDAITYVWENRPSQTSYYPLGRNVVRVKAVDSTGLESQWAAIIFFVADANSGGGMTLTGPESTIIENGLEGATIQRYTFTVPPVSGHSARYDYGQIRGYNQLTGQWEQLRNISFDASIGSSFAATDGNTGRVYSYNGVYMYGTLQAGIYTKLEFYYYTPHTCMYNKSNITYSVEFHFE